MAQEQDAAFEYVFEQEVRAERLERYYALSDRLHTLASEQPGFVHQERRKVREEGAVVRFQTTLRFDTAEHCVTWLDNPERRRLLHEEETEAGFAFQGHANWDGYARWLSRRLTAEPPKWKINLLVLLALYPTVMALTPVLHATLGGVSLPGVMLISNALCVAATSWVLVPVLSGLYVRWLEGAMTPMGRALALGSVVAALAVLYFLFGMAPAGFWG